VQPQVVTSSTLGASGKAKKEYEAACSALARKKVDEAEKHLRKALKDSPNYPAAWVTLGQLLVAAQKTEEGREACSQATAADTTYVAGYLCLADIAARANAWDEVLRLSTRALELDPGNNVVGYEYNAAANLNFHKLDEAEKSALRALEADKTHGEPRVHFVMAQIYEAKGDIAREVEHLREYLKLATNPDDVEMVKTVLEGLDKRMSK
jgi:predicted Zn-dependent protease